MAISSPVTPATDPTADPRRRHANPRIGDVVTFVETAAETGGARTLVRVELAPGGGNPPHIHHTYDERFRVLEGHLTVMAAGRAHALEEGDGLHAQAGVLHCFRNDSDEPVVFEVELAPGHRGFEQAIQIGYGLAADGRTTARSMPKNLLHTALLLEWSEMAVPGMLGLLSRPLGLLARLARRRGVDRELAARYVRI